MRLSFIFIFAALMQVSASTVAQRITLSERNAPLAEVLIKIKAQTSIKILYADYLMDQAKTVNVKITDLPLQEALGKIFENQPLSYEFKENTLFITKKDPTFLERLAERWASIDVSGRVVDAEGKALPGATVKVKATGKGVSTDGKGNFHLKNVEDGTVLVVSYTGYISKEVKAEKDMGSIVLEVSLSKLDEVQVIAYGTTTQRLSTSNITTIKGEDIAKQPVSNLLLALQGRAPGMQLTQSSGVPGADVKVRVQGENSLANGNEALYIIDGIPYVPQNLRSGFIGAISGTGSTLSFLNLADVESVVILKDADATAIYGSRAANGAILITTKKGKSGKTKVDLNMQSGWGTPTRKIKLMNTEQYLEMRREAIKNAGETIGPTDYDVNGAWDPNNYTDWQKVLIANTSHYTNLQASISGGSEGTQFLASGGYIKETTVFMGDFSDLKGNVRINLNHTSKNKKFDFNINSNYLQDLNRLPTTDLTENAIGLAPNAPKLYNNDGTINWAPIAGNPNSVTFRANPAATLLRKYKANTNNLITNSVISYKIIPDLTLKANGGYNRLETYEVNTVPQTSFSPTATRNLRQANYGTKIISSWIVEPQLSYNKTFPIGTIDALIGSTFQSTYKSVVAYAGTNYANDDQLSNPLAAGNITANFNTSNSLYRYTAVFGRFNYQYNNKYILNLSARRDGSSRFGSANLFHSFYSIGGAWLFTEEPWIKNANSFLTFGKIRATYGTTGNDQIQDYQYLNQYINYSANVVVPYQNTVGLLPSGHSNPYLQWEETRKLNFGLDLGFLDNRLIINANYYRNRSSNQLLGYNLPFMTGFSSILRNIPAIVENSGYEFIADFNAIKSKSFNWQVNVNLTLPKNKLIDYPGLEQSSAYSIYEKGQSTNIAKVYEYVGVDPTIGYYQFRTKGGKLTSTPDLINDRTKIVNLNPTLFGGLNNSFQYKGFDLSFLFQFVKQNQQNFNFGSSFSGVFNQNQPLNILDRWKTVGDKKPIQQASVSYDSFDSYYAVTTSDAGYSDASFIRLKTLSLSYTLPDNWIKKANISRAQVYIQGQNLFVLTKFKYADPETVTPSTLPPLRVITFGAQLSF